MLYIKKNSVLPNWWKIKNVTFLCTFLNFSLKLVGHFRENPSKQLNQVLWRSPFSLEVTECSLIFLCSPTSDFKTSWPPISPISSCHLFQSQFFFFPKSQLLQHVWPIVVTKFPGSGLCAGRWLNFPTWLLPNWSLICWSLAIRELTT